MIRFSFLLAFLFVISIVYGQKQNKSREFIELKVYHAADSQQLNSIEHYLQTSLLPALEKAGYNRTGVFKTIGSDTAKDKRLYVIIPFSSLSKLEQLAMIADNTINNTSDSYAKAPYNQPPFNRFETIILQAFEGMPQVKPSGLTNDKSEMVYELRSYESATEALHQNKVQMFNSGEIKLFQRLGFNAVFYGRVIAGSRMPNLMYMTSFENKAARDEHWKAFSNAPEWKALSSKPEYQHNVSKNEIVFLRLLSCSEL